MTLSPRAIEAAARAAYHATPRNKPYDVLTLHKKNLYRSEAEAAITAALAVDGAEPQGWQPIESAPKDGRDVLCYVSGIGIGQMVLYWTDGYWREKANGMGLKTDPVVWQPLPLPPAANDGEDSPRKEKI